MADASCWPDDDVLEKILALKPGEVLNDSKGLIAFCTTARPAWNQFPVWPAQTFTVADQYRLEWSVQLVGDNLRWMHYDLDLLSFYRHGTYHSSNNVFGDYPVMIHSSANVKACTINAEEGAVVIDEGALVMEGCHLRGPVYIGKNAVVKMGTNAYPGTNIGEKCTVGGEIKNCILMGYSNKAHEGYLGDSAVGEWCNFGAGTFVSNVKNTASDIRVWHHKDGAEKSAGQKMGCLVGDFTRTAILTTINSGTTIGVCCSLHQPMHITKHIPSFSWGINELYTIEKALADTRKWMQMKGRQPKAAHEQILRHIFETNSNKS